MCYLNQVKHCKPKAMLYLIYVKQNTTSVLWFTTHVKQNAKNAMYVSFKSWNTQTINAFCFHTSKHSALRALCYLSQDK